MAWEKRNGSYYYYRKERVGDRVVSVYLGNSQVARMIAELIELNAEGRSLEQQLLNLNKTQAKIVASSADLLDDLIRSVTYSMLLVTDHHTHKGQWRRRRDG